MMQFSLWKQLKKRLRRSRRGHLALGSVALFLASASVLLLPPQPSLAGPEAAEPAADFIDELKEQQGLLALTVHRTYICGEETKRLGRMRAEQIIRLLQAHPEWTPTLSPNKKTVVMEQHIEEMPQLCKNDIYMGIDRNGNLSLFEGLPSREKVMRTFFQLDIHYLESSLPEQKVEQLIGGIKINDMDEYNSVLSTFSDFALQNQNKKQY